MRPRPFLLRLIVLPALAVMLVLAAGCESQPRNVARMPGANDETPAPPPEPAQAQAPAPTPPPVQPREILGKRTQDVRDAEAELKKGAVVGSTRIVAKDPITLPGNAYVTIVGQNSILNIQHALDLYNAEHGRYPKDYPEFMAEIIKANNIALPQLPYYQEYGYNAAEHKLIILEYPDRKVQVQKQDDARYGR